MKNTVIVIMVVVAAIAGAEFVAAYGADALDGGADGDDGAIGAGETVFPLAKIKRIIKLDPDVKNITKETLTKVLILIPSYCTK